MKIFKINKESDFEQISSFLKVSKIGFEIMKKKSTLHFIYIKDIKKIASNILKQDALSIGAELVVSKDSIFGGNELENVLLIANSKQLELLSKKEQLQDFGLKNLAKFLKLHFVKPKKAELMGIININNDSFNKQSRFDEKSALVKIEQMINQGAKYIDIGAASSKPAFAYCGEDEEFLRLQNLIKELYKLKYYEKAIFSLDSFSQKACIFALKHGFKMINDISANFNLLPIIKDFDAKYCLMHLGKRHFNPDLEIKKDEDIIFDIDVFFEKSLEEIYKIGLKDIVLDIGFGFGKSPKQNLLLIKHLEHFLHFNHPLLIGASKKGTINHYFKSQVEDRLAGTLYLNLQAYKNGAQILRVHDVYEHAQMFALNEAIENISLW